MSIQQSKSDAIVTSRTAPGHQPLEGNVMHILIVFAKVTFDYTIRGSDDRSHSKVKRAGPPLRTSAAYAMFIFTTWVAFIWIPAYLVTANSKQLLGKMD